MIPYAKHSVDKDDVAAVVRVLRGDRLTQGPIVSEFEAAVARAAGARYAVATSSGTTALWCALRALRDMKSAADVPVGPIRTTPLTFVATVAAAERAGWKVQLVDVDDETLCAPEADVSVDYAGYAPATAARLVDAAHSFGARRGTSACFSFHPAKTITTGEGGAFVTDDEEWAGVAHALRDHGRTDGFAYVAGTNARMSDIHAALGLSQMAKIDGFLDRRRQIAQVYMGELSGIGGLRLPHTRMPHAWHLFVVRVPAAHRARFRLALHDRGVGTQVHYPLVYTHPAFSRLRPPGGCPVAEKAAAEIVSLPLYPAMTDGEISQVVDAVRAVCKAVF